MNSPDSVNGASVSRSPVPVVAAVCGLYCSGCSIYIASHEDPKRLSLLAARFGTTPDDLYCDGCRAERRTPYCRSCELFACAAQRGHDFCSECGDYPCAALETFQRERPHRAEIYHGLERIQEIGPEAWLAEAKQRYSCASCGTINSAYDLRCRACGNEPSSDYAAAHKSAILRALSQL